MQDHTYGLFLSDKHTSKYVFQATANEDNVAPNTNLRNKKIAQCLSSLSLSSLRLCLKVTKSMNVANKQHT